ncbi:tRNA-modifying protein YgfZ [Buchnera aphidicola (Cinara pseudotaxifoliae)]|uniref:tRNA-modifying protein YgfZ n=1 Tax=Buchnera aphidicola (Cinara pseudotaxifoliae) TaxID=655384 RepID=A0A451DHG6_9GAMM|nr:hypothetical protein [Buchnera aphidicola]VFP86052.1 tRNA-modifying protein YgfZ [Buchnera aphidicola (Cinara pseudotaxifoliae)]
MQNNSNIYLSNKLPNMYMRLHGWSVICVKGLDKKKYLNNQFTIDMNLIDKHDYKIGAHCNINGKVWTSFFIVKYNDCYLYIVRSSICKKHLYELKKYSLFSKVDIFEDNNFHLFGLCGRNLDIILKNFFSISFNKCISVIKRDYFIFLKINQPINRFLIIVHENQVKKFLTVMKYAAALSTSTQWLALDIEACFPIIDKKISGRFILQSLDLKKWNAIDFNKGCYYGQEVLCKYENKRINTFTVCSLISNDSLFNPNIGESVEYLDNESGDKYHVGIVLSWVYIYSKRILLQIRIKKNFLKKKNVFFIQSNPFVKFTLFTR